MRCMKDVLIRLEQPEDAQPLDALLKASFPGHFEARLVRTLRQSSRLYLGMVAQQAAGLLAFLLFTPVRCPARPKARLLGLGPVAVTPAARGQGLGTRLLRAGLSAARDTGAEAVFVQGDSGFYDDFGFVPAATLGLETLWHPPGSELLIKSLQGTAPRDLGASVYFHPAFEGEGLAADTDT